MKTIPPRSRELDSRSSHSPTLEHPADDKSGKLIQQMIHDAGHQTVCYELVPDDPERIAAALEEALLDANVEVIVTNGSTGISQRDTVIEVVSQLLEKELKGFGELFRLLSHEEIGAAAMLSRAVGGTIGETGSVFFARLIQCGTTGNVSIDSASDRSHYSGTQQRFSRRSRVMSELTEERSTKKWWKPALKIGLTVLVLVFVGRRSWLLIKDQDLSEVSVCPGWLAVSALCYGLGWLPSIWFWRNMMASLDQMPNWFLAGKAYFAGHLGKYVPGKAGVLLIRSAILKERGFHFAIAMLTSAYETLIMMGVGLVIAGSLAPLLVPESTLSEHASWMMGWRWLPEQSLCWPPFGDSTDHLDSLQTREEIFRLNHHRDRTHQPPTTSQRLCGVSCLLDNAGTEPGSRITEPVSRVVITVGLAALDGGHFCLNGDWILRNICSGRIGSSRRDHDGNPANSTHHLDRRCSHRVMDDTNCLASYRSGRILLFWLWYDGKTVSTPDDDSSNYARIPSTTSP